MESAAYSFGQTYDQRFYKTLSQSPAYFTRVLRGGRRSLTRVLEGGTDDNGRPTLRMVSLFLSKQDWDGQLCGDVSLLLADNRVWQWDGSGQIAAIDLPVLPPTHSIPRKYVPRLLALLSVIERGYAGRQGHVVTAGEFSGQEMACLEMLIPPSARDDFTTAYRTLSPELPATVNCLATEAGSQNRATFRFKAGQTPLSPYAEYLHDSGFASGSIPLETIMAYTNFGRSPAQPSGGSPEAPSYLPPTVVQRASIWPTVAVAMLAVLLSVGTLIAAMLLSESRIKDYEGRLQGAVADIAALRKECASAAASNAESVQKLKMDIGAINKTATQPPKASTAPSPQQGLTESLKPLEARAASLETATKKVEGDVSQIRDATKKLEDLVCKFRRAGFTELSRDASDALAHIDREKVLPANLAALRALQMHLSELVGEWTLEDSQRKLVVELKGHVDAVVTAAASLAKARNGIAQAERLRSSVRSADDEKSRDAKIAQILELSGEAASAIGMVPDEVRQIKLKPQKDECLRDASDLCKRRSKTVALGGRKV
ncbi:MAG: hypothetical protein NT031_03365 [Planctomycetota bacterium]|nr:hypothetical protein [Planctomycetota bacterium]